MRRLLAALGAMVVMLNSGTVHADTTHSGGEGAAVYESLRSLVGEWQAQLPKGEVMTNVFRPIAFGTALLHEEWKNGEQLTATVFYLVGAGIAGRSFLRHGQSAELHRRCKIGGARVLHFSLREATEISTPTLNTFVQRPGNSSIHNIICRTGSM